VSRAANRRGRSAATPRSPAAAGHSGPNTPGKIIRDPQEQTPPTRPQRPLKERFEPESQDVGPLGYSPAELFARMPAPAPAKPRRQYVDYDDDPAEWGRIFRTRRLRCDVCEQHARADQMFWLTSRMSDRALLKLCTEDLRMRPDQAESLVAIVRARRDYIDSFIWLCRTCLKSARQVDDGRYDTWVTVADLADQALRNQKIASTKKVLTLADPGLPPAFKRPEPVPETPMSLGPPTITMPELKKIAVGVLKEMHGDEAVSGPSRKPKPKPKRRH
jgi:hypothetical protein